MMVDFTATATIMILDQQNWSPSNYYVLIFPYANVLHLLQLLSSHLVGEGC
jgi:hypothetical protein